MIFWEQTDTTSTAIGDELLEICYDEKWREILESKE